MHVAFARAVEMHAWSAQWREIDVRLRAARCAGVRNPTVPAAGAIGGVGSIGRDPLDWVNICAARYYGLDSIRGIPRS